MSISKNFVISFEFTNLILCFKNKTSFRFFQTGNFGPLTIGIDFTILNTYFKKYFSVIRSGTKADTNYVTGA